MEAGSLRARAHAIIRLSGQPLRRSRSRKLFVARGRLAIPAVQRSHHLSASRRHLVGAGRDRPRCPQAARWYVSGRHRKTGTPAKSWRERHSVAHDPGIETAFSMGYNGVDYFSPEGAYSVSPEQLDWRLASINRRLERFGKQPLTSPELAHCSDQLKCLVDLCHLHGIAVIFDLVYNHAGGGFDDRSMWFYDRQRPDNQNNSLFFTDHGWAGGQIFAYWNDWVSQFLIDNARFFLTEFRIDGIRYDEVRVIEKNSGN